MRVPTKKKFNIFEYLISIILSVILTLSIFNGLNFNVSIYDIIFLCSLFTAIITFLLKRPQIIIILLTIFIFIDAYLFYVKKELLAHAVIYIDQFVNWLTVYMSEKNWPDGFDRLTSKYLLFTIILTCVLIALIISLLNNIIKSHFLTMLVGMGILIFQWYNFVDKAYIYLVFYVAVCFVNMSLKYYQKAGNGKAAVVNLLIIAMIFSSISSAIAYAMPKGFEPVEWKALNDKFYDLFPFTKTWRNGIGEGNASAFSNANFISFSQDLGGPANLGDQIIMRVKADESTYLRGEVFDTYTSNRWTNQEISHVLGDGNYLLPTFSYNVKYTIKKMEIYPVSMNTNIIFSPWQPYHVSVDNLYDVNTLALIAKVKNSQKPYTVEYYKPNINAKDLENSNTVVDQRTKRYLQYPSNLPERVKKLAEDLTKDKKTDYDKVKAIEQYLRNTYTYDLDVPPTPPGRDFVDYFLFDLKKGYCTYFASSMVVMLRTIGIPARYVVGFKMPAPPLFGNNYDIKASLAHAWVEVYFKDYGWITFEPTAIYSETYSTSSNVNLGIPSMAQTNNSTSNVDKPKTEENQNNIKNGNMESKAQQGSKKPLNKIYIAILIMLIVAILTMTIAIHRYFYLKKYLESSKAAYVYYYNKILKRLTKRGLKKYDNETPIEYQKKVIDAGFSDFDKVTKIYNDLVYGNLIPSESDVEYIKNYLNKNLKAKEI
ncbi:transglutaminaseTgpA domain-containing protein [Thermoanaerobacterium sp. RBIITD]|uniref:transglutaminase TgpA family protein n=1 Tax=Thermoanaerobacterium sp. RBIITD TaxID=1550240 RepID=UPI000BB7E8A0|nr:transglutaminaseTgpA domain-containing protein [Thermoanaerobacterium sp. RBIITD]SNX54428.1 Transglutaminase-like superfamily protein [Thermoanaerobacterium sp. RBIITD]